MSMKLVPFRLSSSLRSNAFPFQHAVHFEMAVPQFTPHLRAFLVSEFLRTNDTKLFCQSSRNASADARCPSCANIYYNVNKYRDDGTSCNLNKGDSGRPETARRCREQAVRNSILQT